MFLNIKCDKHGIVPTEQAKYMYGTTKNTQRGKKKTETTIATIVVGNL